VIGDNDWSLKVCDLTFEVACKYCW